MGQIQEFLKGGVDRISAVQGQKPGRDKGVSRKGMMGCHNAPLAASNTPSPPQPRSNLVKRPLKIPKMITTSGFLSLTALHHIRFRPGLDLPRTPLGEITALLQAPQLV